MARSKRITRSTQLADREEVRDILIGSFGYEWPSVARATDEDDDIVSELNFEEQD